MNIMEAARHGYPEIVKSLLKHGANINATDNKGRTALMWAKISDDIKPPKLKQDRAEIADLLLKHGAKE